MDKESILIIDDEAAIRKLLNIALQSNGYKVLQAAFFLSMLWSNASVKGNWSFRPFWALQPYWQMAS